jgi:hypothetical protein
VPAKALTRITVQPEDSKLAVSLADQFMFQDYYGDRAPEALAKEFGPQFAVALEKLKPGSWRGPIESGYRWHLSIATTVPSLMKITLFFLAPDFDQKTHSYGARIDLPASAFVHPVRTFRAALR